MRAKKPCAAEQGSQCGDEVLQRVALLLEASLRGGDFVGRWLGDAFLLILPGVGLHGARIAAERQRHGVTELPFGELGLVTISLGLAVVDHDRPPEASVRIATLKLTEAKQAGGNRTC